MKNKLKKKALSLVLSALMLLSACIAIPAVADSGTLTVSAATYGDYEYTVNDDNTVTITKYNGRGTNAVIPSNIRGVSVTAIDTFAFYSNDLISISIPNTVKTININAFFGCSNIQKVCIPSDIYIKDYSGPYEYKFWHLFPNCENVFITEGAEKIDDYFFNKCINLKNVTIPSSVKTIGVSAFGSCTGISSLSVPKGLEKINSSAFSGCIGLKSVILSEGVAEIGESAFSGCTGLTSISLSEGINKIGASAFSDCTGLSSIVLPEGVAEIGNRAFSGCTGLTSILLSEGINKIGASAFSDCTGLSSIVLPEGVTEIGESAFSGCTGLTSVIISNGVVNINNAVFNNCKNLKTVILPNTVKTIGHFTDNGLFRDCSSLTELILPDSIEKISQNLCLNCSNLQYVRIGANIHTIPQNAFINCPSLKKLVIPESVEYISPESVGYYYDKGLSTRVIIDGFTIYGAKGSCAERYAKANNIPFYPEMEKVETVPSTCTTVGKQSYYRNNFVNKNFIDENYSEEIVDIETWGIIPPTGHSYELVYEKKATCKENGEKVFKCSKCGNIKKETINKTEHNYLPEIIEPSCNKQGYTVYTCADCGYSYIDNYTKADSHSYDLYINKPSSCTEEGQIVCKCNKCDDTINITVKATGHNYTTKVIAPTDTKKGYVLHTCSKCGYNYKDSFTDTIERLLNNTTVSKTTLSIGGTVTIEAKAIGGTAPYTFAVYTKKSTDKYYKTLRSFDPSTTICFSPEETCTYNIRVDAKDANGTKEIRYFTLKVTDELRNLSATNFYSLHTGKVLTIAASATGGTAPYTYAVYTKKSTDKYYKTLRAFSTGTTICFRPSEAGTYNIRVDAKDADGTKVIKYFTLQVTDELRNTSATNFSTLQKGKVVTISASAAGGTAPYTYAVFTKKSTDKYYKTLRAFSTGTTICFRPAETGMYNIRVDAKDADGTKVIKYFTLKVVD